MRWASQITSGNVLFSVLIPHHNLFTESLEMALPTSHYPDCPIFLDMSRILKQQCPPPLPPSPPPQCQTPGYIPFHSNNSYRAIPFGWQPDAGAAVSGRQRSLITSLSTLPWAPCANCASPARAIVGWREASQRDFGHQTSRRIVLKAQCVIMVEEVADSWGRQPIKSHHSHWHS